ncbi:unnamed protein product [Allacma fusca]|uniref:Spaetzle domain-containing protein n=1 Tax=Allacma fusca TaxID=39272 RepID=A0A8J2KC08_9HEXA|nr:unnamed protein product [Allacma fusca]
MMSVLLFMSVVPYIVQSGYQGKSNTCCPQNHNFYYYPVPASPPTPAPYTPPPTPKQYPFLPAPPGKTPSCAKNGKTFCAKIDTYPTQLIRYLLYKWGRTYGPFIVSESDQPFIPPKEPEPEPAYGYDYPPGTPYEAPEAAVAIPPIVSSYWWNHHNNNQPAYPYLNQHRLRVKRQSSTVDNEQLCPVRTQYFTPQAAMNKDGTWMYVVNMPNETRYVQQVKTESCINEGSSCNNICSLPPGYKSSCRQLMVQKRLVALAGSGDRLMSDVFWFPSCCVCQIIPA